jgi:hypothetical protein
MPYQAQIAHLFFCMPGTGLHRREGKNAEGGRVKNISPRSPPLCGALLFAGWTISGELPTRFMHNLKTNIEVKADGVLKLLSPLPEWPWPWRVHV